MAAIKIPKYIRQKMHRIAHLHATANKEMQAVEAWLENQGFDTSTQGRRDVETAILLKSWIMEMIAPTNFARAWKTVSV